MAKKWYAVHTYSNYEQRVKAAIEKAAVLQGLEDQVDEVLVPMVDQKRSDGKKTSKRFMPGYILVHMEMNEDTWHLVVDTDYVTGFVGDKTNPMPVPESEVAKLKKQVEEGVVSKAQQQTFEQGVTVRVKEGPFVNFQGIVEEVREDKKKLRVLVTIFGRATPVEVGFDQVETV
jgi:transcriptional antiterminator NusG